MSPDLENVSIFENYPQAELALCLLVQVLRHWREESNLPKVQRVEELPKEAAHLWVMTYYII